MPDILSAESITAIEMLTTGAEKNSPLGVCRGTTLGLCSSHEALRAENERLTKELAEARKRLDWLNRVYEW